MKFRSTLNGSIPSTGRTLTDIGREVGLSVSQMGRRAKAQGLTTRSAVPRPAAKSFALLSPTPPERTCRSVAEPLYKVRFGSGGAAGHTSRGRQVTITGELKSKIDRVWDAFWSGGISNPLEVIEQITYLLFIRRLDDLRHAGREEGAPHRQAESCMRLPARPAGPAVVGVQERRAGADVQDVVGEKVFPFLRTLGGDGSTYREHMKDARFTIPTPQLLSRVVDMLDDIPMDDRDTNGDLYEYLLSKIASAGVNGQFRTPRHIIKLMVEMVAPQPSDEICDPACGTAGFLVAAGEYIRRAAPRAC